MSIEEDWGECRHCGTSVGRGRGVQVVVREESATRSTVLCPECATLDCRNCGAAVPLMAALQEDRRGGTHQMTCSRCEAEVPLVDGVEIRREGDPNYRKRVCGDCLGEISVPPGYVVVRDVPPADL